MISCSRRWGLGTAPLGSSPDGPLWWGAQDRSTAIDTVLAAIDAGVAFIDTAPFYGWGRAEEIVGEALQRTERRVPIYTKCGTIRTIDGGHREDGSRLAVRADVERSLERLGVDRFDVVQLHDVDPATPIEITWEAFMELRDAGLIGGAGLSNHPPTLMDRALRVGPVAAVQHQYSLLHREPERDHVLTWCRAHGVAFLAWSPLASGFLADAFDVDRLDPSDLRRGLPWANTSREATERMRRQLSVIAQETGTTMVDAAIGWLCCQPGVTPIIGARHPNEVAGVARRSLYLEPQHLARLDQIGLEPSAE